MNTTTAKQLMNRLNNEPVYVLDVRSKAKYELGHLKHKNAKNINILKTNIFDLEDSEIIADLALPNEEEVIVTCSSGNSAKRCARILAKKGYNVTWLEGGMNAWNNEIE